jgi:predicted TIM-barrel fold metal-dependent hydrolase
VAVLHSGLRVIDIHNHIYPAKVAAQAVERVGEFYQIEMEGAGTLEDLLERQQDAGIEYSLIHSVALKASAVTRINDFIADAASKNPSLIGFATMHQDFEDMEGEIERVLALGLKGFKLHPDSQGVNIDDERLMRFYALIEGRVPVMLHCGDYRWYNSHPKRLLNVLHSFPGLKVNAAHFGGWSIWDLALEYLEHESCYMDLSSSMPILGPRRSAELIELYGPERIMFGSDYPMWTPKEELERLFALNLGDAALQQICWRTAQDYLGFDLE